MFRLVVTLVVIWLVFKYVLPLILTAASFLAMIALSILMAIGKYLAAAFQILVLAVIVLLVLWRFGII